MPNVYRSNTVFTPSGGALTEEVKYAIADTPEIALTAIEDQFATDSAAVAQISTPELVGVQYVSDGDDSKVFALLVNRTIAGDTQSTAQLRIVTAVDKAAAFQAAQGQVATDGDTLLGVVLALRDPLTRDPLTTAGIDAAVFAAAGGGE